MEVITDTSASISSPRGLLTASNPRCVKFLYSGSHCNPWLVKDIAGQEGKGLSLGLDLDAGSLSMFICMYLQRYACEMEMCEREACVV